MTETERRDGRNMEKEEIIVAYGKSYKIMTKELVHRAQLASMIPDKKTLIGIKPNLLGQVLAEEGATTHPEVVEGLIEYLQENGFENIVMLEGSWVGDSTEETVRYCGYDQISEKYHVSFWDMQKDEREEVDCGGMKLNVCKKALQIEFLINVPVLKGHCQTKITCALKNMKGLIPNSEKRRFHRLGLYDPIGHLAMGIHQDFILVDSICGDLTFEDGGNPVEQNRLIAALDPVLCDAYGCSLLGIPVEQVPYIMIAARLGAGCCDLEKARITCLREQQASHGRYWIEEKPQDGNGKYFTETEGGYRQVMKLAEKAEEVDSCSACYGYLIPALQMLEKDGLLQRLTEKICIGQGHRGKSGELGVGNCTAKFRHTLPGCPPTENQMYDFLKNYIKDNNP